MLVLIKTLFLDRDGVINKRFVGAYVGKWKEFEIIPGVMEAIPILNKHFDKIVIVTNQAGIAKGLIRSKNVEKIHTKLLKKIKKNNAQVEAAFYCPHHPNDGCACRKPQPGMAYQAKSAFPEISFEHSVMVGDSASDLVFGLRLGMQIVEIKGKEEDQMKLSQLPQHPSFHSLLEYAQSLEL